MNDQYLSKKVVSRAAVNYRVRMVIGGILSVFFLLGVSLAVIDEDIRQYFFTYVVCLIPFALLWLSGYRGKRLLEAANRYNAIFQCDRDGYVTIDELAKQTGKDPAAIVSELDRLLDKGYLCRCTLVKGERPCVILSDGKADETGFIQVQCPSCGGTTRLRAGSNGRCEYCGGDLKA